MAPRKKGNGPRQTNMFELLNAQSSTTSRHEERSDRSRQFTDPSAEEELRTIRHHVHYQVSGDSSDWRKMPEIPTAAELNIDWNDVDRVAQLKKDVPENPVGEPYPNKARYLEVQYRLHREESVSFLRLAIKTFREDPFMIDTKETCVYTKVFVQGYLMTRMGPVCRVQFSTERAGKSIDWKHSTRLRTGSLVAISTARDGFKTVCMPAVIADRYLEGGLSNNPPTIQFFWGKIEDAVLDPLEELIMVESRFGFFEATRHTMVGLQHLARTPTSIDKYLVGASKDDSPASYISSGPHKDISSLIHHLPDGNSLDDAEYQKQLTEARNKHSSRHILNGIGYDISGYTNLDNSQLDAVHRMIARELAIVQGPPGTGKTFTSVQALQVLINNQQRGKDIIIVSAQTNHAVDQIMVQLLDIGYGIARLGGRTQHEEIAKRTMYQLRQQNIFKNRQVNKEYRQCEKDRGRLNNQIQNFITDVFPDTLLTPGQLHEAGLISAAQLKSLNDDDWVTADAGEQHGPIAPWLGDQLLQIMEHGYKDPIFEAMEPENDPGINTEQQDVDLDACIDADDADDDKLLGSWIPLRQKWTGEIPLGINPTESGIAQQLNHDNLWETEESMRGAIYRHWQAKLVDSNLVKFRNLLCESTELSKRQKVHRWVTDTRCLRAAQVEVIGCTTTGLSKYRGLLSALGSRTILIEEAAETREANITAGLINSLQQLILVGDHQQLAPNADVKQLAQEPFNLKVSMFERLINLGLPFTMLNMQRRMIPPLRQLLNPYYPKLIDHPIVKTRPQNIPGLPIESFFFHHTWSEVMNEDFSRSNLLEAEMIIGFVKYLLMNGVNVDRITILTFYRAQCKKLVREVRRQLPGRDFPEKSIRTVDSYQGEENDIVILSLVRSNGEKGPHRAGFVGNKNRGVVSISRAKQGFFIFGNAINFFEASETSRQMWRPVAEILDNQGKFLGATTLPLRCSNHNNESLIKHPDEWTSHDGGCQELCHESMPCGHPCSRKCHPMDHSKLPCLFSCDRVLHCGHKCANNCSEQCHCERDCEQFSGASLRDTDFPHRPKKQKPKNALSFSYERQSNSSSTSTEARMAAWKIDKYVDSMDTAVNDLLDEPLVPVVTTMVETFKQVGIDESGSRRVYEDIVTSRPGLNVADEAENGNEDEKKEEEEELLIDLS